ncbi:hypothetical protein ILUMI_14544 [Ignelater luminosus]|uniref:Integrase catalytic domain-containing protein n=1 Tax=Ignelater luminosus TaxID=2038154 RepID=A0A8K0G9X6_IGNLU|nr:hypothetical protein ILUMI_14544 [Ignelater luminosus]
MFLISKAASKGHIFRADLKGCTFTFNGEMTLTGRLVRVLDLKVVTAEAVYLAQVSHSLQLWHEQLDEYCDECVLGKAHRGIFRSRPDPLKEPGAVMSADICELMKTTSLGGNRYFALFEDDCSKYRRIFFLTHKNELADRLKIFLSEAKQKGIQVKILRCENTSEFVSRETMKVARENGVRVRTSALYCPVQNGSVERENRTIVESARSMLQGCNLPKLL